MIGDGGQHVVQHLPTRWYLGHSWSLNFSHALNFMVFFFFHKISPNGH